MGLRFLVLEGNTREIREGHKAGYGLSPAESYGEVLLACAGGGRFDVLCASDADAELPQGTQLSDYDGVAITGSALHIWQEAPEALRQVALARAVFAAQVPFFGSCWGLQVAAVAAGGVVSPNPRGREVGFARKIMPNAAGAAHPLLAGRPAAYDAPCSHLDEVSNLPPASTVLASNAVSAVQAAEIQYAGGTFWGVQYHPEYSLSHLAFLLERRITALLDEGIFANEAEKAGFVADLKRLDAEPKLKSVAWRYGLGQDVTEPDLRMTELHNFITHQVRPHARARQG
jgi:GMP synthase (glutamine-hydrolysing)